jgi:hypothetical protein
MNKRGLVFCIQLLMVTLFVTGSAKAADWRFPLGLTYYSGCIDVVDRYEENLEAEGRWRVHFAICWIKSFKMKKRR